MHLNKFKFRSKQKKKKEWSKSTANAINKQIIFAFFARIKSIIVFFSSLSLSV